MPNVQDLIAAEVDRQLRQRLNAMQIPILTQSEGTPVSGGHRTLNFQGAGVTVSDDSGSRRTNVFIPGALTASSTSTFVSAAGAEKVFTPGTPPTNWQTNGFNDSTWGNSVAMTIDISGFYALVSGSAWTSDANTNYGTGVQHDFLFRRSFTPATGTITGATLEINADDGILSGQLYLNGTQIGASMPAPGVRPAVAPTITLTISPSLLTAGSTNVLAGYVRSGAGEVAVSYKLTLTYGSAGADTRYELVAHKDAASGYPSLDGSTLIPTAELGTGTADSSHFLRGDRQWIAISGGATSPLTTKGDLWGFSTVDARVPVGSDGQVLIADSTQSPGVKWGVSSGVGGLQQIARTVLGATTASVTFSSIPGTYSHLLLVIYGRSTNASLNDVILMRFNGDSAAHYDYSSAQVQGNGSVLANTAAVSQTSMLFGQIAAASATAGVASHVDVSIPEYAGTTYRKLATITGSHENNSTAGNQNTSLGSAYWQSTAAITSILVGLASGSWATGSTFTLYGRA